MARRAGPPPTPLAAVALGLAAGVVGTGCMTAWQMLAAKLQEGDDGSEGDQPQQPTDPWEQASAPAKVAKRIGEGVFQAQVPADRIPLLTHAMHWGYGTGWGAAYGLIAGSTRRSGPRQAATFGAGVWAMSYAQLVPMGLYDRPWTYPPKELALDLSYHLAYGAGVAATYRCLDRA